MQPTPFLAEFTSTLTPGTAIDIGCGNGRNAYFLSDNGWRVTAVDLVDRELNTIPFIKGSLPDLPIAFQYNLTLCLMVLHFLGSKTDIEQSIRKLQQATSPNGYLIVSVMTDKNEPGTRPHLFSEGELEAYFSNWKILKSEYALADPVIDRGQSLRYWVLRLIVQNS